MKRFLLGGILFFCFNHCFAQIPLYSKINLSNAFDLIKNYQTQAHDAPSSFLLNVQDFYYYIYDNNTDYLHVYFATTDKNDKDKSKRFLVVVGTVYQNLHKYHEPNDDRMWITTAAHPNGCTKFDPFLEPESAPGVPIDDDNPNGCQISNCTTGLSTKQFVDPYLKYYQDNNPSPAHTQSFLIKAKRIRRFLNYRTDVQYLQFYIGKDPTLGTSDGLTLVVVGVDSNGNHIYANGGFLSSNYMSVFNEGLPCPLCGIDLDASLPGGGIQVPIVDLK